MSTPKNTLAEAMRGLNSKAFNPKTSILSYKTGFPVLDYHLGYLVNVYDDEDNVIDTYPALGINAGCFATFIGKPSTGKTTLAIQIAANIVRNFPNGMVVHFDLEEALNYTRIHTITKLPMSVINSGKYILNPDHLTIKDIKEAIMQICLEKREHPETYLYDTGLKSEFNKPIITYEPTVCIIDSIPNLRTGTVDSNSKKDIEKLMDVKSQTEQARLAGEISRFYTELQPWCKEFNVTLISINQIKQKIDMGFIPSPADIMYLDRDETMPGGVAPQYQAHILLKLKAIGSEKYDVATDGFGGFGVQIKIIKARTNQAGIVVPMIYDKVRGMDSVRSSVLFAKSLGKLGGNKNGFYFPDHKDDKFTQANMLNDFRNNRNLYKYLYEVIIPPLESKLSQLEVDDIPEEELLY